MTHIGQDSLKTRKTLTVDGKSYDYYSLKALAAQGYEVARLPYSIKVVIENLLRHEDGQTVTVQDIQAAIDGAIKNAPQIEMAFNPARVLMQDFTGVPAVVDLATMRDAMVAMGQDPKKINPLKPVDLVIDHSVMVDHYASPDAFRKNVELEVQRNQERYVFLRWGQKAFKNLRVVPPGTGICHQVNLEYLGQTVWISPDPAGKMVAYPDTVVGTDSHTTMINGLAVLGWGVGGIEAEAVMLGQPISMLVPRVVGFKMTGRLPEGATATDLVLTVTNILRAQGVVGKFVEFFGDGLDHLTLADRATISNMAPEYGATAGFFPIDAETLNYLRFTGRDPHRVALVEAYAKEQGMWREPGSADPVYEQVLTLDLATIQPTIAGPKRPQDKVLLKDAPASMHKALKDEGKAHGTRIPVAGKDFDLGNGDVTIAAITSCTNTSNPSVLLGAGLLAQNALARGLKAKPWVKTSLAPGSQVVTDYLAKAGLDKALEGVGFYLVGYGCTTCIGNSGPLMSEIEETIKNNDLTVAGVLSGNRNFEGRIHPLVKLNYLASPMVVVAYALAGNMAVDFEKDPLGVGADGKPVYLRDIWPSSHDIQQVVAQNITPEMFRKRYANVFDGDAAWQGLKVPEGDLFQWDNSSTYIRKPPYFEGMKPAPAPITDIKDAHVLALLGDSITTDHISPAGAIKKDGPAGLYLQERLIPAFDFNSYGARRGNHEVMMRGTFANIRIKNEMLQDVTGGLTRHLDTGQVMSIYDASLMYQKAGKPLVIVAGKEYGTGSSRDWAAKGTRLLGVKAVLAESFERIHRSNLIGMGVLPLEFAQGQNRQSLKLDGSEEITISGIEKGLAPKAKLQVQIRRANGETIDCAVTCRIDTQDELNYYRNDGILPYVLRNLS